MKKRTKEPWMSAAEYGRGLRGLTLNLLVRDVAAAVAFLASPAAAYITGETLHVNGGMYMG